MIGASSGERRVCSVWRERRGKVCVYVIEREVYTRLRGGGGRSGEGLAGSKTSSLSPLIIQGAAPIRGDVLPTPSILV